MDPQATHTCPRCQSNHVTCHYDILPDSRPYDRVSEDSFYCQDCKHLESRITGDDDYRDFVMRWGEPIATPEQAQAAFDKLEATTERVERAWKWPVESRDMTPTRAEREKWREIYWDRHEYVYGNYDADMNRLSTNHKRLPQHEALRQAVLAAPDDDGPRDVYATWLGAQTHDRRAAEVTEFIRAQMARARAFRADYRDDIARSFRPLLFAHYIPEVARAPSDSSLGDAMRDDLTCIESDGLIAEPQFYRGFIEHVAMRAHRFLEIADELFEAAPIRFLTLTYCKGFDHQDDGLFRALLDSPHLARIRALRLPSRHVDHKYAELNRLKDADMALFAQSKNLRKLRYLDLIDGDYPSYRSYVSLAESTELPELSFVHHDIHDYQAAATFASFGDVGPRSAKFALRRPDEHRENLLSMFPNARWIDPMRAYGTMTPELEVVVENPVALRRQIDDVGLPKELW